MPRWNGRTIYAGRKYPSARKYSSAKAGEYLEGEVLVTRQGISFFGGVDPDTGMVVERGHELEGQSIAGKVLVFPSGKGSTVGSYTLYRLKHSGKAPLAILNATCETITAVGCIIAEIPCLDLIPIENLQSGMQIRLDAQAGWVETLPEPQVWQTGERCTWQPPTHLPSGSTGSILQHLPPGSTLPHRSTLPPPLGNWEPGSFAEYTIRQRLPQIARETAASLQTANSAATNGSTLPQCHCEQSEAVRPTPNQAPFPPKTSSPRQNDPGEGTVQPTQAPDLQLTGILANLEALAAGMWGMPGMPYETIRPLVDTQAPDAGLWEGYLAEYVGKTWLELPWFLSEIYFYRRILEATGYYQPGWGNSRDPYTRQKQEGLEACRELIEQLGGTVQELLEAHEKHSAIQSEVPEVPFRPEVLFHRLLTLSLWGNQFDLSMWAPGKGPGAKPGQDPGAKPRQDPGAKPRQDPGAKPAQDSNPQAGRQPEGNSRQLIADDIAQAAELLASGVERVDFILDNTGSEFSADLALVDFLLTSGCARHVRLHVKAQPTYVSDVTLEDLPKGLEAFLSSAAPSARLIGQRLQQALAAGQLSARPDFFWNSPLPAWEMPGDLCHELSQADLLIFKGDANFRRLLGDRHWPLTTPFSQIAAGAPAPVLALRVCKSQIACSLQAGQPERLSATDSDWMVDGKWGLAVFSGRKYRKYSSASSA